MTNSTLDCGSTDHRQSTGSYYWLETLVLLDWTEDPAKLGRRSKRRGNYKVQSTSDRLFLTARTLPRSKESLWWGNRVSKYAVFRHEMFFPVSFWTLLFVTISWHFLTYHFLSFPVISWLCYTLVYSAILCYTLLYFAILCYTLLYHLLYFAILYYTLLYFAILCYTLLLITSVFAIFCYILL